MTELSLIEKSALKALINLNNLGKNSINVCPDFINEISIYILFKNKDFLEEIILKAIVDKNSLEYDLYNLIDEDIAMTDAQAELWDNLKNKIALQYLSSNVYEADKIPAEIDIIKDFKK